MIFIENKYTRIYYSLIQNRKASPLIKGTYYCEAHHIIPRSLGGTDDITNIVNLSAREHYIAHKLLTRMTEGDARRKMWWAFHRILHSKDGFKLNSRSYDRFRLLWSNFTKVNHPSYISDSWGEVVSKKIAESWLNDDNRRAAFSISMKKSISEWRQNNTESFILQQRSAALKNKMKNCERIEYNGSVYIGWSDFAKSTGIEKRRFIRWRDAGIPLDFRKGLNGPMTILEMQEMIRYFCNHINEPLPFNSASAISILDRMVIMGLFTANQKDKYMTEVYTIQRPGNTLEGDVR